MNYHHILRVNLVSNFSRELNDRECSFPLLCFGDAWNQNVEIHTQIYNHQGTGRFMAKDHNMSDTEALAVLEQKQ